MEKYLLSAVGHWVDSHEHQGGKRDIHSPRSKNFSKIFEAVGIDAARTEANRLLTEFQNTLPKKREGSLSWQDNDAEIADVVFSMILEL